MTLNDIEASTSRCPKPSWCKHPSRDSEIDSHEYEWDSFPEPSIVDMDVDVVHRYSSQLELVDESCVGLEDLYSHVALVDDSLLVRTNPNLGSFGSYLIDFDSLVTRDIIHVHNLGLVIDLPLIHPNLIDWSQCYQEPKLLTFQNDYEIATYLNSIEPIVSCTSESATSMTKPDIKYLSHKIKRIGVMMAKNTIWRC